MTTEMSGAAPIDWERELGWTPPSRLPSSAECTVRPLLERWAAETPDKLFALFENGVSWTYAETLAQVRDAARGLAALGVRAGDPVLNWLPNGADHLRIWLAANYLGAIHVPIATTARSGELQHICSNSSARLIAADRALAGQLAEIDAPSLETVVLFGDASTPSLSLRTVDAASLGSAVPQAEEEETAANFFDIALIIYTSGTTGLPKGVRCPYAQFWSLAKAQQGYVGPDDRLMISTSLSHISTVSMVFAALFANASIALFESFSASRFWDRLRATGSTALPGLGPAIIAMLLKHPPSPSDRDNPLRIINVRAPSDPVRQFCDRFGADFYAAFGMTEASCVTLSARNSTVEGSCGRPRPGIEVRIVDGDDIEVAEGAIGEIILRADQPWTLNAGYHDDAAATVRAWRNGWFHTGDLASRDAQGNLTFHDRLKDCIRRRGENISSQEVEQEAMAFPAVQYAAAVGVAGAFDDQELLLIVEPVPDGTIDPAALVAFIATRLSYFKVPRYVCVRADLPRTTFGKIRKFELMTQIDLAECWDREREDASRQSVLCASRQAP